MEHTGYAHFADALVFAHGPQALAEAMRHAELARKSGDMELADHWQNTIIEVKNFRPKALPCCA